MSSQSRRRLERAEAASDPRSVKVHHEQVAKPGIKASVGGLLCATFSLLEATRRGAGRAARKVRARHRGMIRKTMAATQKANLPFYHRDDIGLTGVRNVATTRLAIRGRWRRLVLTSPRGWQALPVVSRQRRIGQRDRRMGLAGRHGKLPEAFLGTLLEA